MQLLYLHWEPGKAVSRDHLLTLLLPKNVPWTCLGSKGAVSGHTVSQGKERHLGKDRDPVQSQGPIPTESRNKKQAEK